MIFEVGLRTDPYRKAELVVRSDKVHVVASGNQVIVITS